MNTTRHDTTARQQRRHAQVGDVVAGVLALAAFASSLRHVQTVAATHGQAGWLSWSIAIGTELVAFVAILEIRRGRDHGYRPVVGWAALVFGMALSGGANLATAHGRGWFWSHAMALAPVVEYLIVVVMVEVRPGRSLSRKRKPAPAAATVVAEKPAPAPVAERKPAEPKPVAAAAAPAPGRLTVVPPEEPKPPTAIDASMRAALDAKTMTQVEAAEQLGISVRTLQRRLASG